MNSCERSARNDAVVAARARGLGWAVIASTFSLSERQARRIVQEYRNSKTTLGEMDPVEVVEEALEMYAGAAEELALVAATTTQESVRTGAIKARMKAIDSSLGLMQAVGLLPHDLRYLKIEMDARVMAKRFFQVLDEHEVPVDVQEALMDSIRPLARPRLD